MLRNAPQHIDGIFMQSGPGHTRSALEPKENVRQVVIKSAAWKDLPRARIEGLLHDVALDMRRVADGENGLSGRMIAQVREHGQRDLGRFKIKDQRGDIGSVGQASDEHVEGADGTARDTDILTHRLDPRGPHQITGEIQDHSNTSPVALTGTRNPERTMPMRTRASCSGPGGMPPKARIAA